MFAVKTPGRARGKKKEKKSGERIQEIRGHGSKKKVEFSKLSVHEAEEKLAVTPDWAMEQNQSY